MPEPRDGELNETAQRATAVGDVRSATIFVVAPASAALELAAAAGIEGPALDGLVAAVRNPAHPIVRALTDNGPTFDVLPMNPGGPRLRSHLPLRIDGRDAVGVLALAHEEPMGEAERAQLTALADEAATAIDG